jgi:hypothetical protein
MQSVSGDGRSSSNRLDRDVAASATTVDELHPTGDLGEQGVIAAQAHIQARLQLGATLANEDRSTGDDFAAELLYA